MRTIIILIILLALQNFVPVWNVLLLFRIYSRKHTMTIRNFNRCQCG